MLYPLQNVSCGGILMRNISLFVEDYAHEMFLTALVQRLAFEKLLRALQRQFRIWQQTED